MEMRVKLNLTEFPKLHSSIVGFDSVPAMWKTWASLLTSNKSGLICTYSELPAKERNCNNDLQHQLHFSSPPCADGRALQNKENQSCHITLLTLLTYLKSFIEINYRTCLIPMIRDFVNQYLEVSPPPTSTPQELCMTLSLQLIRTFLWLLPDDGERTSPPPPSRPP
ncbi:2-Oxoglutarate And Iron-Dependent Oxygenase Jmjd4 [Manis pentadactyla]|nr:2-Oxoglutarate And Iron-Dependent Oxygenase Jmjd4 [Manis pentadactyla]